MVTVVPAAEVVTACRASRPARRAATILLPRLPVVGQSHPSGRPTPSSATWMRTMPSLRQLDAGLDEAGLAALEGVAEGVGQDFGDEEADAARGVWRRPSPPRR